MPSWTFAAIACALSMWATDLPMPCQPTCGPCWSLMKCERPKNSDIELFLVAFQKLMVYSNQPGLDGFEV